MALSLKATHPAFRNFSIPFNTIDNTIDNNKSIHGGSSPTSSCVEQFKSSSSALPSRFEVTEVTEITPTPKKLSLNNKPLISILEEREDPTPQVEKQNPLDAPTQIPSNLQAEHQHQHQQSASTGWRQVNFSGTAGKFKEMVGLGSPNPAEAQEKLTHNPYTARKQSGRRRSSVIDPFSTAGGLGIQSGRRRSSVVDPFNTSSGLSTNSTRRESDKSLERGSMDGIDPINAHAPVRWSLPGAGVQEPQQVHIRANSDPNAREVLLINPITGERRQSLARPASGSSVSSAEMRRPSIIPGARRDSRRGSVYTTVVRRDSEAAVRHIHRQSVSQPRKSSMAGRRTSTASVVAKRVSFADPFADPSTDPSTPISATATPTTPRRKSSIWQTSSDALFGNFAFGRRDSVLPTQEPMPAYQDDLGDAEMIEIPIEAKPNTGFITRRASLFANVFSNEDVDVDPDLELKADASEAEITHAIGEARTHRGNRKMLWSRNLAIGAYVFMNAGFIAFCFGATKVWYILIPLVVFTSIVNSMMVLNLTRIFLGLQTQKVVDKVKGVEREPEIIPMNFMTVLPCYNESYEELMGTLDSITNSTGIDMHKQMIVIVCDGKVRGKGQAKTTPQILQEDILTDNAEEIEFVGAYQGWTADAEPNTLWCRRGYYKGIPYILTVKQNNRGKRDGLIMVRNLLYAYNNRNTRENTYSPAFFNWCREWAESNCFSTFDWLVGTDADTIFEPGCIAELYRQSLMDPSCVGTCGLIKVGFRTGKWKFWNLYQNAEYIRGQMLRRLHQSYATHRVTCLPGACQIIKVCEETCGPKIMEELFGYYPRPMDNIIQKIRSLAGEDRNYVVNMMMAAPNINTRQAVRAVAYTDPPTSLSVFLSQRRRWTLSTCANDLIVIRDPKMKWFERMSSCADLLTWFLPVFILATVANFLKAAIEHHNVPLLVGLSSVVFLPWLYTFISVLWVPENWEERLQYLLGLCFLATTGPFMTALVISYAIKNSHVFGWGKTRQLEEGDPNSKPAH
ncbi:hypothetical protein H2203_006023 [Taxawa tesnikishii (nom. ined.)]|nr:hypothetical protein H2203_006023 [Dothideales sp. JES 119]